jgi:predicted site-specific integrase-resolvase
VDRLAECYCGPRMAAIRLGLSEATVRLLADSGRIRSVRDHAGRRLLLRHDVERVARERAQHARRARGGIVERS